MTDDTMPDGYGTNGSTTEERDAPPTSGDESERDDALDVDAPTEPPADALHTDQGTGPAHQATQAIDGGSSDVADGGDEAGATAHEPTDGPGTDLNGGASGPAVDAGGAPSGEGHPGEDVIDAGGDHVGEAAAGVPKGRNGVPLGEAPGGKGRPGDDDAAIGELDKAVVGGGAGARAPQAGDPGDRFRDAAKRAIEAMVMVAEEPMPPHLLAQLLEISPVVVDALCRELAEAYEAQERGFELVRVAGGWRYQSHPDQAAYVERLVLEGQSAKLSAAALETLAIVAYKQPISRAQVAAIRGVSVDGVMRTLQQRGLIVEVGKDSGPGQAVMFGTSTSFLEKLGLNGLDELPPLGDFVPTAEVVEQLERGLRPDREPLRPEDAMGPVASSAASNGTSTGPHQLAPIDDLGTFGDGATDGQVTGGRGAGGRSDRGPDHGDHSHVDDADDV